MRFGLLVIFYCVHWVLLSQYALSAQDSLTITTDSIELKRNDKVKNPFEIRQKRTNESRKNDTVESVTKIQPHNNPFDKKSYSSNINSIDDIPNRNNNDDSKRKLIFGIITLLGLILLVFGVSLNQPKVQRFFQSLYNTNTLKSLFRNTKTIFELQHIVLYFLFIVNGSLFLALILDHFFGYTIIQYWLIPLCLLGVYIVRHIIMALISFVFTFSTTVDVYNYSIGTHNIALGIILFPFIIGLQFGAASIQSILIYFGLIIIGVIYLLRQFKGLLLAITIRDFNLIYFFIYLCAVEIAPILVILRITEIVG